MGMSTRFKVAILGLQHDHVWTHLDELHDRKDVELVAAADPNLPLLNKCRERFRGSVTHTDYDALLDHVDADAAFVYGSNRESALMAVEALERGWHVMVEKPMASTLGEAERMLRAARSSGKRLMVNWPFAWWPGFQMALQMAREGVIGRIWQVKYRAAHEGPRAFGCSEYFCQWLEDESLNGAGALMDYGCYGCALACDLLGKPRFVLAIQQNLCRPELKVDDNAVILLSYPDATAIAEASWSQIGLLTSYVTTIYGETGTLLAAPGPEGRLVHADCETPIGRDVPLEIPAPHLRNATAHFLWGVTTGEPFLSLVTPEVGRDAQAVLEAAIGSARIGAQVTI